MDRNQITGLVLMFLLLVGYAVWFAPEGTPEKKPETTTKTQAATQSGVSTAKALPVLDSAALQKAGDFASAMRGTAQEIALENADVKLKVNTQGGLIAYAELKNYKRFDQKPLILVNPTSSQMNWTLETNTGLGKINLNQLFFTVKSSSPKELILTANLGNNQSIEQSYKLKDTGFDVAYNINLDAVKALLTQAPVFTWQDRLVRNDFDVAQSRQHSALNYFDVEENFEQLDPTSDSEEEKPEFALKWFAMKDRFFNAAFITEKKMQANLLTAKAETDAEGIKSFAASVQIPVDDLVGANFKFYFGPNDYDINQGITAGFEKNVYLGWAVVAPINRLIIMPLFNLLEKGVTNYGWLIIILVVIVRICMLPLSYKQFQSAAYMKALAPELEELRKKHGDDAAKLQQDQMKLYSQFGVNPLSGCLPMLLQMPIFFALFSFFPSAIQFRGAEFAWIDDLSTYESIINLPFNIPFYGQHVSLLTLLMTGSQIWLSTMTAQPNMSANQPINPKVMMYGFPLIFMFVLNSFPSALSLYYCISNLISIAQSIIIRNFIVDEKKIRQKLEANSEKFSKGEVKKSKFQERMEQALRMQDAMQQEQRKNIKKRT
ncbi:MAG: membrane protein insertase YidC [Cytophagales bacterium]|nr:MAG: membrane protein insertase YidC [Cytophagales bacterium]TAF61102.1 MAG: membrane protein insertase YidC [Cytophagales bacterium]